VYKIFGFLISVFFFFSFLFFSSSNLFPGRETEIQLNTRHVVYDRAVFVRILFVTFNLVKINLMCPESIKKLYKDTSVMHLILLKGKKICV